MLARRGETERSRDGLRCASPGDEAGVGVVLVRVKDLVGTLALHGVGLAGAGLAVGKDGAVVPLHHLAERRRHHRLVDLELGAGRPENVVVGVCPAVEVRCRGEGVSGKGGSAEDC